MQIKQFDSKANELAQWLLPYNQSNYNCWYVKKMCYLNSVVSYEYEMKFSEQTLEQKVKSFQIWDHRRFLLQNRNERSEYQKQFQVINKMLDKQPKNYHAWSHRVWLVDQTQNYQDQINFTHNFLKKDLYNNSVWAYRFHLFSRILAKEQDLEQRQKLGYIEICEKLEGLEHHLNNQAAWNYLRGYFPSIKLSEACGVPCENKIIKPICKTYSQQPKILQFVRFQIEKIQKLFNEADYKPKHYHLEAEIQLLITLVHIESQSSATKQYAKNTCMVLAQKDKQKRFYWNWVAKNL